MDLSQFSTINGASLDFSEIIIHAFSSYITVEHRLVVNSLEHMGLADFVVTFWFRFFHQFQR